MVLLERELPPDHSIVLGSDNHEGTILQHRAIIEAIKDEVTRNPHTYFAHGGDHAEAITIDDKRYSPDTDSGYSPLKQYQNVKADYEPIAPKTLVLNFGNHDWKLFKFGNMVRDFLCKELSIPYGTYVSKISIKDPKGNLQYKIYLTHGRKTINSIADDPIRRDSNMKLILKRHLAPMAADCLVMVKGHAHKLLAIEPTRALYLYDDGTRIKSSYTATQAQRYIHPDLRFYGCSGSSLRLFADPELGVSGYGELAEYAPNELGYLRLRVEGGKPVALERVVIG